MKEKSANPVLWGLAMLLTAALLLSGLTSSASAGNGGNGTAGNGGKGSGGAKHGKCKRKSNGGAKSSATNNSNGNDKSGPKKKCGKRKPGPGKANPPTKPSPTPGTPPTTPGTPPTTPGTPPTTPEAPPAAATLAISPGSVDFGNAPHGGFDACQPDPDADCPTRAFTVTNTGGSTSGVPTASVVETRNPESEKHAAFQITANTCTAALAPGASCSLTVKFSPKNNAGDEIFSSRLDVTASPGGTASSVLNGTAS